MIHGNSNIKYFMVFSSTSRQMQRCYSDQVMADSFIVSCTSSFPEYLNHRNCIFRRTDSVVKYTTHKKINNGKSVPVHAYGAVELYLHYLLAFSQDGGECSASRHVCFSRASNARYLLGRSWMV